MKTNKKALCFGVAGILAMIFVISFASAAITISSIQNPSVYGNSFNVVLTTDQALDEQVTAMTIAPLNDGSGNSIIFNIPAILPLVPTGTSGITVPITYTTGNFNFNYIKTYSTIMTVNGTLSTNNINGDQKTVTFSQRPYCDNVSNNGNLRTEITDVKILSGFGDDDNYWYPMDEVEIELNIENDGNWDVKSIDVDWALYTTDGKKIADDELSTFKLKEGDDKTLTFKIKLDENIDDFENQDVVLFVKAKGTIDDNASVHDNEDTCDSDSTQVQMITDDNFVILENFELSGVALEDLTLENYSVICGEEIEFIAEVWNTQSDDEQDVSVSVYNKELGINQIVEIGDVDAFDKETLSVKVKLPSKIENKWYSLLFEVLDEDGDVFENSEDGISNYNVKFKVEGCNVKVAPLISAELGSEAKSGQELTVKTVVTNPGNSEVKYNVKISDYADWAELITPENTEIILKSGESKEISITFDTNKKAVGEKTFNVEVLSGNEVVAKQPVAVTLEKSTTEVKDFIVKNWKLIGIILLNLILVIAIIAVIVKIYRK